MTTPSWLARCSKAVALALRLACTRYQTLDQSGVGGRSHQGVSKTRRGMSLLLRSLRRRAGRPASPSNGQRDSGIVLLLNAGANTSRQPMIAARPTWFPAERPEQHAGIAANRCPSLAGSQQILHGFDT